MADQTQTQPQKPRQEGAGTIAPFTVEFGDDRCGTISINTLKRRVRGRFSIVTLHKREGGGRDIGRMGAMPDIPGIRMQVIPSKGLAILSDPLREDDGLRKRIVQVLNNSRATKIDTVNPDPNMGETKLNPHQLKTLLVELRRKVLENPACATVIEGDLPTEKQIDSLPGRVMHDPWNSSTRGPKFKDEVDQYERMLESQGV